MCHRGPHSNIIMEIKSRTVRPDTWRLRRWELCGKAQLGKCLHEFHIGCGIHLTRSGLDRNGASVAIAMNRLSYPGPLFLNERFPESSVLTFKVLCIPWDFVKVSFKLILAPKIFVPNFSISTIRKLWNGHNFIFGSNILSCVSFK